MTMAEWKDLTDVINNVVVILAALAGGTWAVYRLWRERTDEAALNLNVSRQTSPFGKVYLVAITLELANKGKTKIQAKPSRNSDGFAFDDGVEKLRHCCSLQIKRFTPDANRQCGHVDWFEAAPVQNIPGLIPEINMLTDYEDP